MEASGQLCVAATLPPREKTADTHWAEGWMGPRADLGDSEKTNISCHSWESNALSSNPYYSHYTNWTIAVPDSVPCK